MTERKWLIYWLDPRDEERPVCSEDDCGLEANRIICSYENGVEQGEFSKVGGWFFCPEHTMHGLNEEEDDD